MNAFYSSDSVAYYTSSLTISAELDQPLQESLPQFHLSFLQLMPSPDDERETGLSRENHFLSRIRANLASGNLRTRRPTLQRSPSETRFHDPRCSPLLPRSKRHPKYHWCIFTIRELNIYDGATYTRHCIAEFASRGIG